MAMTNLTDETRIRRDCSQPTCETTYQEVANLIACNHLRVRVVPAEESSLSKFREDLKRAFSADPVQLVVANYHRCAVHQPLGAGHHSPIGAYDEGTDEVLVLDVHYSVYPPTWFPLELFWGAVLGGPAKCNTEPRGYLVVGRPASGGP